MEPNRDQARRWVEAGEIPEPIVRENIHKQKRMLILAIEFDKIAFYELMLERTTVDANNYSSFLERNIDKWLWQRDSRHMWL